MRQCTQLPLQVLQQQTNNAAELFGISQRQFHFLDAEGCGFVTTNVTVE